MISLIIWICAFCNKQITIFTKWSTEHRYTIKKQKIFSEFLPECYPHKRHEQYLEVETPGTVFQVE